MGLFDFGKKEIKELKAQVRTLQSFNNFNALANINRNIAIYPTWDMSEQSKRYTDTDDIYSIIRLLAVTAAGIPMYGYEKTPDQKAFRNLVREQKYYSPYKYKNLQTKALEDLPEDDPVAILLENPNEDMSRFEFLESVYSSLFLCGEAFLLKQRPEDGKNAGKTVDLLVLFPQCVTLRVTSTLPRKVVGYDYTINGTKVFENLPAEQVIHIKYWNPDITQSGNELRGLSPIKILKHRLVRLESNMNVSVAQLQNSGVETIVYDETPTTGQEVVDIIGNRKNNYYKFASNVSNAGMPYFASGKMGVIQLGSTLADMNVDALAKTDFKKVCNIWAISDRLFNNDATGSEVSDTGARKGLFTNAVLPNVQRVRDALVRGLLPDFRDGIVLEGENGEVVKVPGDGKDRYIDLDISQITELHEDIAKKVAQFANLPIMIPNMILEEMGFPTVEDDPNMDKVYVKSGYTPIDDFEVLPPIDPVTDNGN